MTPGDSVQPAGHRQPEDGELIRRIKSGDKLAYADFYDRCSRPLYSVALRILNDRSEAEEILESVFRTLWEKAGSFDETRGSALNWVIMLTRHRAIDRLLTRPHPVTPLSELPRSNLPGADSPAKPDSADDSFLHEKISAARQALAALPADQLQTLELAYFGGLNQPEIASQSGEPIGTVRSRIRHGLLKLRDVLPRRHD